MLELIASYSVKSKNIVPTAQLIEKQSDKYMSIVKTTGIQKISKFNKDLKIKVIYDFLLERAKSDLEINPDGIIVCTQTPDEPMPALSSQIAFRNKIKNISFFCDINAGCTGFVDVCELANNNLLNKSGKYIYCFTGDINSRIINENDYSLACVFGDLINLSVLKLNNYNERKSFFKQSISLNYCRSIYREFNEYMYMNGMEVMSFINELVIPSLLDYLDNLSKKDLLEDYTLVIHQANRFIVEFINKKVKKKFTEINISNFSMDFVGNSGSSTIPQNIINNFGKNSKAMKFVICGFGVGMKVNIGNIEISKTASFYDLTL